MLKEYLSGRKSLLIQERDSLFEKIQQYEMLLKENEKLISVMKEAISDSNFESFSPRTVNTYQKNKICELEEDGKRLRSELNEIRRSVSEINMELLQLIEGMKEYEQLVSGGESATEKLED